MSPTRDRLVTFILDKSVGEQVSLEGVMLDGGYSFSCCPDLWLGGRVRGTSDLSRPDGGNRSPHSHTPQSHFPFSESTEELPVLLWEARPEGGHASVKGPIQGEVPRLRLAPPTSAMSHTNPTPVGPLSPAPVLALRPQPRLLICPSFSIPWPSAPLLVWGLV